MQQTQWSPSTPGIAACAVFGVVMATACVTVVTDGPGRILGGIAAVGLLVFATLSWRARPKLAITPDGLQIRGWLNTVVLGHDDISGIRITEFRRIGRKVYLLEIDAADDRLHVFTRWDLGTNPLNVLDALTEAGYAGKNKKKL
jgi:hypothetical protein